MNLCEGIAKKNDGKDAKHDTDPLFFGKRFPKHKNCRQSGQYKPSAVDDGEKDGTIHHARQIQIEFVVDGDADAVDQHNRKQDRNRGFLGKRLGLRFFFSIGKDKDTACAKNCRGKKCNDQKRV